MKLNNPQQRQALKQFFFAGLLPVIAFTVVEEKYGTVWGIVAGMVFGGGEIIWEWVRERKVSGITWFGNIALLVLGGISLISQDGIWFKLQPAFFEVLMVVVLWGSLFMKKPLLIAMAEKQGAVLPEIMQRWMRGLTVRLGFFFAVQTVLAVWAAFKWSTEAWALLKGVGVMVSLVVYMLGEMWWFRRGLQRLKNTES